MLNSFVCLARLLNLSHASQELGFTRQTIKRHITELEAKVGEPLFDLDNRKYILTEAGHKVLPGAKLILLNANSWIDGISALPDKNNKKHQAQLDRFETVNHIEKHSISMLIESGPEYLKRPLRKWIESSGRIDHKEFVKVQPYAVNFRKQDKFWICIHIGKKSSLASWLGEEQATSTAGQLITESPITGNYVNDAIEAYDFSYYTGDFVYDHVTANIPQATGGKEICVNYQRLVLPCWLPNNEPFISSFVFRTNDVVISKLPDGKLPLMDQKWLMKDG